MIAQGPRIRSSVQVSNARLIDLAPTVFHLLGFVPPAEMDGRVLSEMLMTAETAATEVTQTADSTPDPVEFTPEEAAIISDHLRALGYL